MTREQATMEGKAYGLTFLDECHGFVPLPQSYRDDQVVRPIRQLFFGHAAHFARALSRAR